jgi:hypothetical protein
LGKGLTLLFRKAGSNRGSSTLALGDKVHPEVSHFAPRGEIKTLLCRVYLGLIPKEAMFFILDG